MRREEVLVNGSEWFYLEAGQQRGPVSLESLVDLLRTLPPGTLVWRDGLVDWMKAEDVPEVAARLAPPPPRPASAPASASGLGVPPPLAQPSPAPASTPAARQAYRPAPSGPRPTQRPAAASAPQVAPRPDDEPETLNPFVLFGRSLRWSGRFSRAEYAVAYFGTLVMGLGLVFGLALVTGVAGKGSDTASAALGLVTIVVAIAMTVISVGAALRRLHDLGQPGFFALGLFLPCLNFLVILYLLFAPGQLDAASKGSPAVIIVVALLVLVVPVIGIVAAIAIPSLLRARVSAHESATIGDVRSVLAAQIAYSSMNGGYYESRIECLAQPGECIENSTAASVLSPAAVGNPKSGYMRELVASPTVADLPPGISRTSTSSYAFVAHPVTAGQTGVRSFCGDSSGRICYDPGGRPNLTDQAGDEVRCSDQCLDLQ